MSEFKPKIVSFLCNWCSYAGADSAGNQKLDYQEGIRIIRVMCSGRIDPTFVMSAFRNGADGVIVMGCHLGDCHYRNGNIKTMRRMEILKRLIKQMGYNENRFRYEWVAAGESEKFRTISNEMASQLQEIGPLTMKGFING